MQVAIDLRSDHGFWAFAARHRSLLDLRFPTVSLVEIADARHAVQVLRTAEAYFGWRFAPAWFSVASRLRWIASPAAGVDHLPLHEAIERGVTVTRSFGFHGTPIAEHVMGLVLGFARGLFVGMARQRTDLWWKSDIAASFFDVSGATMTIVGCGSVGNDVARLAHACGMTVLGVRRTLPPTDSKPSPITGWFDASRVEEALAQAKVVVNLLPAAADTMRFFDERRFATMPRGAVFINVGRGSTVDEPALTAALAHGHLAGCGLDVTARKPPPMNDPLRQHPRVVLTPKTSVFSHRYMDHAVEFFADNLDRYLTGSPLRGLVTSPLVAIQPAPTTEGA
ncbi:D-2-hydroxyacid dehydrogenase [Dactylosporangium sp. CA-092794]|uniref:D-2-hydroxyacid dehydrogenase n=1 Tax=Dactylosporangium sp. CA-092794 TaxID=3239929 RepID=UPI003D90E92D